MQMVLCNVPLGRCQLFCVDIIEHDKLASMNFILFSGLFAFYEPTFSVFLCIQLGHSLFTACFTFARFRWGCKIKSPPFANEIVEKMVSELLECSIHHL
jgi:hypothetical protein